MTGPAINFTDRAQSVLNNAARIAHSLDHKHVGTEHLALALVRVSGPSVLSSALKNLGTSALALEKEVESVLSEEAR